MRKQPSFIFCNYSSVIPRLDRGIQDVSLTERSLDPAAKPRDDKKTERSLDPAAKPRDDKKRERAVTIFFTLLLFALLPASAIAGVKTGPLNLQLTHSAIGFFALGLFIVAYALVMAEEFIHLRKSKPVVLAAGIIWILIAYSVKATGQSAEVEFAIRHNILEYAELFLFLLVAMTYVNAMDERYVFEALRAYLVSHGFTYRQLFCITGLLAFFISPIADNLTTALLMCAVVMAIGADNRRFVTLACINVVVAANAGGAFSPFGDITTLMVWQKGLIRVQDFSQIFLPSVINYAIPAFFLFFAVPKVAPPPHAERVSMKHGAITVIILFLLTILTAITFHNFLHLPPATGMMMGLAYLQCYGYYLKHSDKQRVARGEELGEVIPFDIFRKIERAEWDTLLFFYGIILCVGGLATLGYLSLLSDALYNQLGAALPAIHSATPANIVLGLLSAIVDNIPIMFAVLTMHPHMSEGQWLLITLTAGTGGSLLSVGSAAGVALMGQSKGRYTFFGHFKWSWAILLGYFAAIGVHLLMNHHLFTEEVIHGKLVPMR